MNTMLTSREMPALSPQRYETTFGFPVRDYYRNLGFDFERESFETLSDEFIAGYYSRLHECDLRDGTQEVLTATNERGLTQSILSAMKQDILEEQLKFFGLQQYFTAIVGLNDHHAFGKTDTGKRWIANQHLNPEDMVFVGDTIHDHEVAQAIHIDCRLIYSGHHDRARLAATGSSTLEHLSDLYL